MVTRIFTLLGCCAGMGVVGFAAKNAVYLRKELVEDLTKGAVLNALFWRNL